jgi:hypothetical protein
LRRVVAGGGVWHALTPDGRTRYLSNNQLTQLSSGLFLGLTSLQFL